MQLHLLIADHFDTLANGKMLALGLFTDRVVVMHVPAETPDPTPEIPYALELGLLLTLTNAPTTPIHGEVRIVAPGSGPPVGNLRFDALSIRSGDSANILTKLKPLLVPHAGTYTVEVHAGDEVLSANFEVRIYRMPSVTSDVVASDVIGGTDDLQTPVKSAPKRRAARSGKA